MDFSELVESRQSFHSFSEEEIGEEELREIFEEVRRSPTAWNLQPYEFLVLDSEEKKEDAYKSSNDQEFLLDADKIVVVMGDERIDTHAEQAFSDAVEKGYMTQGEAEEFRQAVSTYSERGEDFVSAFLNKQCSFACCFLMLAAWNRGIGSCPVAGFDAEELSGRLDLDEHLRTMLMLPLGYPEEDREKKWRRKAGDFYSIV
ncbi:MAG: nitroreductase family protein [Candidatus Nanohaloarchaea archaeon]